MPLLEVKNISVEYPSRRGVFRALNRVSMTVEHGKIHGLVGESGAGKSTVGSAIMGLLEPPGHICEGEILMNGEAIGRDPAQLRGSKIGMIFQDPMTSLDPLFTVGHQLVETIRFHLLLSKEKAWERAVELLRAVDIPDPDKRINQFPHQFSGGMRQRVVIALTLCSEPEILIADEPTTALDVSVQAQVLDLFRRLTQERNLGAILITHDMGVIAETTDVVSVMYEGEIVETGETRKILTQPEHPYTKSLISAVPLSDRRVHRFPRVSWIEEDADTDFEDLLQSWAIGQHEAYDGPILELRNLTKVFKIDQPFLSKSKSFLTAVDDVSFEVKRGEIFGIVGESGSGKSTIARVVTRLYNATEGDIYFSGQKVSGPIPQKRLDYFRRNVQMIFQDPYSSMNPRMRIADIIREPMELYGLARGRTARQRVYQLLDDLGIGAAAAHKYPHEFSGGQRQRIAIGRALSTEPCFMICDEPTSALDVSVQAQILNLLKELQDNLDLTMLFISHDLPVMRQMCDRICIMQHGRMLELQETDALFDNPKHGYTKNLLELMPKMIT